MAYGTPFRPERGRQFQAFSDASRKCKDSRASPREVLTKGWLQAYTRAPRMYLVMYTYKGIFSRLSRRGRLRRRGRGRLSRRGHGRRRRRGLC